jgi:hypothetical protein
MPINTERVIFQKIFDWIYLNKRVSWDYPFTVSILKEVSLTLISNINLINNIGYRIIATHTINLDKLIYPGAKNIMIKRLKHLNNIVQDKLKDLHMFYNLWDYKNLCLPWSIINLPKRLIKYISCKFIAKVLT